jgi:putative heme-binding domain-containing protein
MGLPAVAAEQALVEKLLSMADDPDPRVRFQLAFTLGDIQSPGKIGALAKIARQDCHDPWVRSAILSSVKDDSIDLFDALVESVLVPSENNPAGSEIPEGMNQLLEGLARMVGAKKAPSDIAGLLERIADPRLAGRDSSQAASLEGLASGLDLAGGQPQDIKAAQILVARFLASSSPAIRQATVRIASRVLPSGSGSVEGVVEEALATATDEDKPETERVEAVETLRLGDAQHVRPALEALLTALEPEPVEIASLQTLNALSSGDIADIILSRWKDLSPAAKQKAMDILFARKEHLRQLLAAIEKGNLQPSVIEPSRQNQLSSEPDETIAAAAKRIFSQGFGGENPALFEKFRPALELEGNSERGAAIHKDRCAKCHKVGDVGFTLGPDWAAVRANPKENLMTSILYPNRVVAPGFTQYVIETVDGDTLTGVIGVSGPSSIVLKNAGGVDVTVLRKNIASIRDTALSIMPTQLEEGLSTQDMADLLEFIQNP